MVNDAQRQILRVTIGVTLVAGLVTTAVGALRLGSQGLIAGLLGTTVVIAFFSIGQVVLARVLDRHPELALSGALALYLGKVLVLLLLLALLRDSTLFDGRYFGITVFIATVAWILAEVAMAARTKVLVVDSDQLGRS